MAACWIRLRRPKGMKQKTSSCTPGLVEANSVDSLWQLCGRYFEASEPRNGLLIDLLKI